MGSFFTLSNGFAHRQKNNTNAGKTLIPAEKALDLPKNST
jgi:hypothetical protein